MTHQSFDPSMTSQPLRALEGIRVLDFSHALAGPYCTLLLADYGAEVYKLESPHGGELGRGWGPPFIKGEAAFFMGLNRGKRGISIDLKRPEGMDLCLRLLDRMDVLVENFRPGTMGRLGLGYEAVQARNPRLVYCSISGYGQDGPSRDEAAMDLIVECSTGFLSITGTESGEQVRSGYAVSMFDGMISAMSSNYMAYLGSGQVPRPLGTGFPTVVPYRVFHASDRVFSIAVGSEKLWAAFCHAIGRPELQSHPAYATNALRIQNRRTLEQTLEQTFQSHTAAGWIEILSSAGIPCSLVRTFAEVVEHPQAAFREMFPRVEHSSAGTYRATGSPIKMSRTPGRPSKGAPLLGQDTRAVLTEILGLDAKTIARLIAGGAIKADPPDAAARGRRDKSLDR